MGTHGEEQGKFQGKRQVFSGIFYGQQGGKQRVRGVASRHPLSLQVFLEKIRGFAQIV